MITIEREDTREEYKPKALESLRRSDCKAPKIAVELRPPVTAGRLGKFRVFRWKILSRCCQAIRLPPLVIILGAFLLGLPVEGTCQSNTPPSHIAAPATPAAVKGILAARRFTLGTPFPYSWTKEHIMVSSGTLVVLEVDPALVVPRDTLEPVLYAGNVPVMRLNHGHKSGRVVGIIPGDVNLVATPIWFGAPELPGRVTTAMAEAERARAEKAGALRTFGQSPIVGLDQSVAASQDLAALLRTVAADLVLKYSPQEKDLADQWRLPVAKVPNGRKP